MLLAEFAGVAIDHARRYSGLESRHDQLRQTVDGLGQHGVRAKAGLVVPLLFRGQRHGVLVAIDRREDGPQFSADDQRLLEAFAASAATAIATAETVEAERGRQRLAAAEQERARWARELHDETLQSLAAVRLGLAGNLRGTADPNALLETIRESVELLDREIGTLRALITDLRPAALDDIGAQPAIEDLVDRARERGLELELSISLAYERGDKPDRHESEVETAIYRIQEALNNARRHAGAGRAWVEVEEDERTVRICIRDDGRGFDTTSKISGFGLLGMQERAELVGGTLEIASGRGEGTTVLASLPANRRRGTSKAA